MKNSTDIRCNFEAEYSKYAYMKWKFLNQPLDQCDMSGGFAPAKKRIWPAIIMAAAAIGSAAYSGAKSSEANNKSQRALGAEQARTQATRRRKYNEDYIDTSAGQNLIRTARNEADKIWRREQGTAAMTGATEKAAMAKQYGNDLVGEAIANIAANDTARKERVDEQYEGYERQLNQQQIALDHQKAIDQAQAGAQMISGLGSAAASYAGTYMGSPGGSGVTAAPSGGTTPAAAGGGTTQTSALQNMGGGNSVKMPTVGNDMFKHNFGKLPYNSDYLNTVLKIASGLKYPTSKS